jgi:competence protein ComEA
VPFRRPPPPPPDPAVRARVASLAGLPDATVATVRESLAARLPETVRSGRLDPGRRGVAALCAIAALALAVTGVVVWRGRPRAVPLAPPAVTVSAPPAALLVVDVAGDVRRPGLVRLPPGSRVADAIAAAGGLRPGATTGALNLARKVADGEQVLVGAAVPGAPAAGPAASGAAPLDLNAATADQLDALPGIGPVLADRIVAWRTAHGGFTTLDQLREVDGIGARKYESLKTLLRV